MTGKAQYQHGYWWSNDGLRLHYRDYPRRDYPGRDDRPPILCIPGLTRNARDFEDVAGRLSPDWRVICVDLRGRGESAYAKDSMSYAPLTYLQDIEALIAELKLSQFVAFGTSLGGIMTMLLAATGPGRIAGALINDIGPDIETGGLDRIRSVVGKSQSFPTWVHASRWISEVQSHVFPNYGLTDWLAMAKRTCRLTPQGRVAPDYDMRIADPMKLPAEAADLWPAYRALGDVPVTMLRGSLSDILTDSTAKRMVKELPKARLVTVKKIGHAPALDEPESVKAIDALLASIT